MQQTLADEALLELVEELQVEKIFRGQGFLSNDGLHGLNVLSDGIAGILE